jgi:hypothetical protein
MRIVVISFLTSMLALAASATPITYTITGIGSGGYFDIATSSFNGLSPQRFTIQLNADTNDIQPAADTGVPNSIFVPASSGIFQLGNTISGGLSSFVPIGLLASETDTIGLSTVDGLPVFPSTYMTLTNAAFTGYGLDTNLGPLNVSAAVFPSGLPAVQFLPTSFGAILFDSVSGVTFTSTTDQPSTPEPASYATAGLGLVVLGVALRKRNTPKWHISNAAVAGAEEPGWQFGRPADRCLSRPSEVAQSPLSYCPEQPARVLNPNGREQNQA